MKKIIFIITLVMTMVLSLTDAAFPSVFVPADNPNIRYQGRWDFSDPKNPAHSWPGVVLFVNFSGRSIGIRTNDNAGYYNINIGGKSYGIFHGDKKGIADYILIDSLSKKRHSLRLSLRNFAFDTVYTFSGFLIDEGARLYPAPKAPHRKIEFIGDSYTSAEGNEVKEEKIEWSLTFPLTNIDEGFAATIARHYKAEYHTTSRSGIGLVCDWQGMTETSMTKYFDRTLMEKSEPKWDFASWKPDLVVLALGLNDISGLRGKDSVVSQANSELFRKSYHDFLNTIRKDYPGVQILAVASYPDWIRDNIKQVVTEENAQGNSDVSYTQYDYFTGGYVANGHPTIATHRKMAKQIISAIDELGLFARHKK